MGAGGGCWGSGGRGETILRLERAHMEAFFGGGPVDSVGVTVGYHCCERFAS